MRFPDDLGQGVPVVHETPKQNGENWAASIVARVIYGGSFSVGGPRLVRKIGAAHTW